MNKLDDAFRRQQAVQRSRTIAWALFSVFVAVSLLLWSEATFTLIHTSEAGILQPVVEFILALFFTFAAVQMFRVGMRLNHLLADPSRLLDDTIDSDGLVASSWSALLSFSLPRDQHRKDRNQRSIG